MKNLNLIAYSLYLPITFYITLYVGKMFYKHGEVYLHQLLPNKTDMVKAINSLLLTGYYLLNLGYATVTLSFWERIATSLQLLEILSTKLAYIILILGSMHLNNMLVIYLASKYQNKQKFISASSMNKLNKSITTTL